MKEFLLFIMLIAVAALWYDDHSKQTAIDQSQQQIRSLTAELEEFRNQPGGPPTWFQQHLNEQSLLDPVHGTHY